MRHDLVLVPLSQDQIAKAKEAHGKRKRITHALLCGPYGQLFGTEKQCLKYYEVWSAIFPQLFKQAYQAEDYAAIDDFQTQTTESRFTGHALEGANLTLILIDKAERRDPDRWRSPGRPGATTKPRTPTIVRPHGWKPGDSEPEKQPEIGCLGLMFLWVWVTLGAAILFKAT